MFLGFAATFYTLLLVYSVFTVALMAVLLAGSRWRQGVRPRGPTASADGHRGHCRRHRCDHVDAVSAAGRPRPVSNTGSAYHYLPATALS
ncbi:arabinofuranosyltransferase AftA domain protein [Mycobacterium xenopi 4042]|uniref:Arabinofuranosyltransferase AftA domain protein n=1 Tax=Mycobacterium xenopi 4042 TaxID=1299334 RepID=X8DLQ8_MYCXE|nr:arabinofuranosyltransferase AftA domain protein [Mycobacterium xenopi 4042]